MASPLTLRGAPQCLSCIRRISNSLHEITPANQQIRGKKKLARLPKTVKVQLLQNVPGYGRRGAVIPVTSGVMRNIWHPKQMAEYLTATKAEDLGIKKDTPVEREYTFKSNEERKAIKQEERVAREILSEEKSVGIWEPASFSQAQDPVPQIELGLLTPGPASVILERTLPSFIEFWRTPIAVAPKRISPSIPTSSSVSVAEQDKPAGKTSIYGSVSTSDIAADLKAILADVEEASRVVLSAENIVFVEETEDKDRVKHLGVFEIEIRLDGAPDSIKRSIKVNALK